MMCFTLVFKKIYNHVKLYLYLRNKNLIADNDILLNLIFYFYKNVHTMI